MEDNERLAVITSARFGTDDHDTIGIHLGVEFPDGGAGLYIPYKDAIPMIRELFIQDVSKLKGSTCIVKLEDGYVRFVKFWSPAK